MSEAATKIRWGVERRLEFIEFRLFWEGGVNRSDIIRTFNVSEPQASKDLTLYQERAPENAVYDKNAKRYVATDGFRPVFLGYEPNEYLLRLRSLAEGLAGPAETWLGSPPEVDFALTPAREVETEFLRAVLVAVRENRSVEGPVPVDEHGAARASLAPCHAACFRLRRVQMARARPLPPDG